MSEIKKVKPSLPSGTRDFLPQEVAKRNYIFGIIKSVLEQYGFQQIETPVLENLSTLTGKYGEEGDQLLFKVLNSGNPFEKLLSQDIETIRSIYNFKHPAKPLLPLPEIIHSIPEGNLEPLFNYVPVIQKLADRGLRYDLTVPLARYVVQHQNDLVFPFKRYHIAPVWRADRPQKGRYREFYQCDADIIGSNSLLNEVELTQIYLDVFKKLKIDVTVQYSSRNFLVGLAELCDAKNDFEKFVTILDKNDKIGLDELLEQLSKIGNGICGAKYKSLIDKLSFLGWEFQPSIDFLKDSFAKINSESGLKGISDIEYIYRKFEGSSNLNNTELVFHFHLARGLNYYSGIIWEVVLNKNSEKNKDISMGSIGGGGRYANLTEMFGGRDMSGVGISFGVERIYDIMEELKLFPQDALKTTEVLFVHFSEANRDFAFPLVQQLRNANVSTELYPDKAKMEKQMKYANAKGIPYVVVIGDNEMQSGKLAVKDMRSGTQEEKTFAELLAFFATKQ